MLLKPVHIGIICVSCFLVYVAYSSLNGEYESFYKLTYALIKSNNTTENTENDNFTVEIISTTAANIEITTELDQWRNKNAEKYFKPGFENANDLTCSNSGQDVKLLALVISAPAYFKARMAIRNTWGSFTNRVDVSIAFFMGTTNNTETNEALHKESNTYSDIIFAHFHEDYRNLTLKTISMMQWVAEYCPKAKFLLKVDDDMFINIPKLLNFIDSHISEKNTIFGRIAKSWRPIRDSGSKYFVPKEQFSQNVFPDFATGPSYLLSASLAFVLYEASLKQKFMPLEDVFMTGIVAQSLNINRVHLPEFKNDRVSMSVCSVRDVISIHMVKVQEQFDLWAKVMDEREVRC